MKTSTNKNFVSQYIMQVGRKNYIAKLFKHWYDLKRINILKCDNKMLLFGNVRDIPIQGIQIIIIKKNQERCHKLKNYK